MFQYLDTIFTQYYYVKKKIKIEKFWNYGLVALDMTDENYLNKEL